MAEFVKVTNQSPKKACIVINLITLNWSKYAANIKASPFRQFPPSPRGWDGGIPPLGKTQSPRIPTAEGRGGSGVDPGGIRNYLKFHKVLNTSMPAWDIDSLESSPIIWTLSPWLVGWVLSTSADRYTNLALIPNCCCIFPKFIVTISENNKNKIISVQVYCVKYVTMSNCGILNRYQLPLVNPPIPAKSPRIKDPRGSPTWGIPFRGYRQRRRDGGSRSPVGDGGPDQRVNWFVDVIGIEPTPHELKARCSPVELHIMMHRPPRRGMIEDPRQGVLPPAKGGGGDPPPPKAAADSVHKNTPSHPRGDEEIPHGRGPWGIRGNYTWCG